MAEILLKRKRYEIDDKGHLVDWQTWDKDIARHMAKEDGCKLTKPHWVVIEFLRDFFEQFQIAPMMRMLILELRKKHGKEIGNSKHLLELFGKDFDYKAVKYSGLSRATGIV